MTRREQAARRQIRAYLTMIFSSSLGVALLMSSSPAAPIVSGMLPMLVVLIISLREGTRPMRGLGLGRPGLRYWPVAVVVPAGVAGVVYLLARALGMVAHDPGPLTSLPLGLLLNLALTAAFVLSEEVGWRGYLLPRINQATGPRRGALLTGLLHALVHVPLMLLTATYNSAGSRWLIVPVTVVTITSAGVLYAWLRVVSGSIWPAALAHAAGNTVVGMVMATAAPGSTTTMAYLAGEGGVLTSLGMVAVAVMLLTRSRLWIARPS